MKFSTAVFGLGLASFTLAQTDAAGPSPTESVGCEPHGDHWHCEAHVTETGAMASATGAHDHEEEEHDDHDHEHSDEEHSDEEVAAAGPSPTESVGCEPHGDHWHCEGPVETASVTVTESGAAEAEETPGASETPGAEEPEGGNAGLANIVPLVGAIAAAAMAL